MSDEAYTIFCRNLAEDVTETLLYELFLQAGPVEDVRIPMTDGKNRNYGFIVYKHKSSVKYAIELFRDTKLYGKTIALQNRILDAERVTEMRNRSWRNDEVNCLRGGPAPNFSRFNDMNILRGGMPSNYSRNDDISSLRGGPMSFSRKDSMIPRSFCDDSYNLLSAKSESDHLSDPRFINPYSSFTNFSEMNSRGSPISHDRHSNGRHPKDRRNRDNRERFRNDKDNHRKDWKRRDRDDFSRKSSYRDDFKNDLRNRLGRSRSRDRSPLSNKTDKQRPR